MGKSIRSKIKRKHRAEFRNTIGTEAYNEQQKITQSKLKECLEKQTLKSFDKLSDALETDTVEVKTDSAAMKIDSATSAAPTNMGAENKVIINKRSKRKQKHSYKMKSTLPKQKEDSSAPAKTKRKPKFFCQF